MPIRLIASADDAALEGLSEAERSWVEAQGWSGKQGSVLLLPDGKGGIGGVLLGTGGKEAAAQAPLLTGVLAGALPEGDYRFASPLPDPELAALGFLAGSYRFTRYKAGDGPRQEEAARPARGREPGSRFWRLPRRSISAAISSTRRPTIWAPRSSRPPRASLPTPSARSIKVTEGSGLLSDNFPMIHAVGRASDRSPASDRSALGIGARAEGHDRRQGHLLRYRRPRHQAGERHGADEEGHGRRRRGARLRASGHAREAAGAAARADPRGREQHRRQRLPAGRRAAEPQRHDGRDRQYRRRGAPGAGRRHHASPTRRRRTISSPSPR